MSSYYRSNPLRFVVAIVMAIGALISYFSLRQQNPVTGETQHIALTVDQERALGLQAAPDMAAQYGGEINSGEAYDKVNRIGQDIVARTEANKAPYTFAFHLLADPQTINAFALPGGQVFITKALYDLLKTDGELAGVLGHEIGHVIERHSAQQMAQAQLTNGLTGAAAIASYDPNHPSSASKAAAAAMIGKLLSLRYSREDETQADGWGVKLMTQDGYDPHSMIKVMEILQTASGNGGAPEFLSTHPDPGNRIEHIKDDIQKDFPDGVPAGLKK